MIDPKVREIVAREMPHVRILENEEVAALRSPKGPSLETVRSTIKAEAMIAKWSNPETIRQLGQKSEINEAAQPQDQDIEVLLVERKTKGPNGVKIYETLIVSKKDGTIIGTSG